MPRGPKPAKSKEAKPPVAPKSPKDKGARVRDLEKRLAEAQEQQAATAEILRVISSSPTDIKPVLDAVARSAMRLCESYDAMIMLREGEELYFPVHHGPIRPIRPTVQLTRRAISREWVAGRAVLDRQPVHVHDLAAAGAEFPVGQADAVRSGYRTTLSVPFLREGEAIGAIHLRRREVRPFTDSQIALLQTFAAQAVIAIENVRLFNETKEALEQQTATSEILRVISQSPTDVQPVFDAIVRSASRLCGGEYAIVTRYDGQLLHLAAQYNPRPGTADETTRFFPQVPRREALSPRAFVDAHLVHAPDVDAEDLEPSTREFYRRIGLRAVLAVPMIHEGRPIGVVSVSRGSRGPFSDRQITLLQTFADQAVIAIENVRLFTELQEKNRALTQAHAQVSESLERQTATSEILRVISQSPTDLRPVFETIVRNAVQLCGATYGSAYRIDGDVIYLVAETNLSGAGWERFRMTFPRPLRDGGVIRDVVESRRGQYLASVDAYPFSEAARALFATNSTRSLLTVPMIRQDQVIGAFSLFHPDLSAFPEGRIELVRTFADQAVIAIENVRLFKELEARTQDLTRSVGELRALGEVGQAISSTLDLQTVLTTIVGRATHLAGMDAGVIYEYDEEREIFEPRATERLEDDIVRALVATPIRKGEGATGQLAEVREPIQVADVRDRAQAFQAREVLVRAGYRAALAVPLVRENRLLGGLTVFRKSPGEFAPEVVDLLRTFATQSALAIQNARLFREIGDKSRQLEVASQHKSEFLANMSHELRTPLNAIIGFSEVLSERMFGELNEKQEEYSKDIHASGQHLLSLINDILDLSKIEAGRMELELSDFHLPTALDSALTLVRERAWRRAIALQMDVDSRLGEIRADERKVRQVVLNLLSNAIKFTPEGGQIEVQAAPKDGLVEVSVSDTGVGIAPEDQEAVFEEFRQVGTADKKVEGTGLGLTLCRKFVELHGGRIWVKSEVGMGSTFAFTLPLRHRERAILIVEDNPKT